MLSAFAQDAAGFSVALGIGALVGIERERSKGEGAHRGPAGLRTFLLIALTGAVCQRLGPVGIAVGGTFVGLSALASYRATRQRDPGLTTEVAMLIVFLLGILAIDSPPLAGALGVVVAVILAGKPQLHRFTRQTLSTQEVHDGLLLAAAAAVVLPLLPDRTIDPWDALNPRKVWMLVVLVMAINAAGYIALRVLGAARGLALAGFFGGFVSSTATIAAMGDRARAAPALLRACVSAALFSNIATVVMLGAVCAALAPSLLQTLAWPLALGSLTALITAALARAPLGGSTGTGLDHSATTPGRPFEPRHALAFAAIVSAILLLAAIVHAHLGDAGLHAATGVSGFADVHAAAASVAQLVAAGSVAPDAAGGPVLLALIANSLSKATVAWLRGGRGYALRLLPGLIALCAAFALGLWVA